MSKVIVITGASSGIGQATAELLARQGNKMVLGARRESCLQEIVKKIKDANGEATYAVTDVTDLASVKKLAQTAMDQYGKIAVWMNNAGVMPQSTFIEGRVEDWNRMIDVNLRGVLNGIAAALPIMRKQASGHFINTSSVAGHATHPGGGVYSATKAGVLMISEALRQEEAQAQSNVRVTVVSPGAINTELVNSITDPNVKKGTAQYYDQVAISPDQIAKSIAFAINAPESASINEIVIRPSKQA
ncbi:oxidoreductase [Pediococcus damnosus LMG 28219]|uniref:SDR family oxidoreductase n=1 Tax=Pediococcus damnosus TaxID=51663 RepID=UPI00061FFFB4|nr:SDR family oxidoreductase [Pediococcus damnosus]KJU73790.1 oxidoreductase [Pediococcus damnosus LMG 28219]